MELVNIARIGADLAAVRLQAQFAVAAVATQINTAQQLGSEAIQLIQASALEPHLGQNIDLRI